MSADVSITFDKHTSLFLEKGKKRKEKNFFDVEF